MALSWKLNELIVYVFQRIPEAWRFATLRIAKEIAYNFLV